MAARKTGNAAATIIGAVFATLAVVLLIPVFPLLFFAKDSRDLTGGVAGGVLVLILGLTGVVLVLREKTPGPLLRAFHLGFGGISAVVGIAAVAYAIYSFS